MSTSNPTIPFTILRADQRVVDAEAAQIRFPVPAPANAHLRFAGIGDKVEISVDGGKTWQPAVKQAQEKKRRRTFQLLLDADSTGTQSIQFRGDDWWGGRLGWRAISQSGRLIQQLALYQNRLYPNHR